MNLLTGGLLVRIQPEEPAFAHPSGELRPGRLTSRRMKAVSPKQHAIPGCEGGPLTTTSVSVPTTQSAKSLEFSVGATYASRRADAWNRAASRLYPAKRC